MDKKTRLILTVLGIAAVIVPVVLLIAFTSKTPPVAQVSTDARTINESNVKEIVKKTTPDFAQPTPEPSATESAVLNDESQQSVLEPSPSAGF